MDFACIVEYAFMCITSLHTVSMQHCTASLAGHLLPRQENHLLLRLPYAFDAQVPQYGTLVISCLMCLHQLWSTKLAQRHMSTGSSDNYVTPGEC